MFKTIDIVEGNSLDKFRKGELPAFKLSKGVIIGGVAFGAYLCKGLIATLFVTMGQLLGALITGVAIIVLLMFLPLLFKVARLGVRSVHKMLIRYAPFEELYEGLQKMFQQLEKIKQSIGAVKALEDSTKKKASEYETKTIEYADQIEDLHITIDKIKAKKDEIVKNLGKEAENDDEYVRLYLLEHEKLALVTNMIRQQAQAKDLIIKYGVRHANMKKGRQKLEKYYTFNKIKLAETETSIKILETDYQFAKEGVSATNAALAATKGLDGSWTTQYALEVATNSISADLQQMEMGMKELDALTTGFDLDNDTMYDKLLKYTDDLKIKETISVDKFTKHNYTPTEQEKTISGLNNFF